MRQILGARPRAHDVVEGTARLQERSELELGLGAADDPLALLLGDARRRARARRAPRARCRSRDLVLGHARYRGTAPTRRLRCSGPPAASVCARATWAIVQRPCRIAPGQADRARELLVEVDRVEVARRARVADGEVAVGRDAQLGDRLTLGRCELAPSLTARPARCGSSVPRQTSSPRWLRRGGLEDVEAEPVALVDLGDRGRRRDLVAGDHERAPARTPARRARASRSRARSPGSKQRRVDRGAAVDDGEHRAARRGPRGRRRGPPSRSRCSGLVSPMAARTP